MSEHNEKYTVDDPRLTAFALGELKGDEAQAMEEFVAQNSEARAAVEEIRACTGMLELELAEAGGAELTNEQREAIDARLEPLVLVPQKRSRVLRVAAWVATAAAVTAFVWVFLPEATREKAGPFAFRMFSGDQETAAVDPLTDATNRLGAMGYVGGGRGGPGIVNAPVAAEEIYLGYQGGQPNVGVIDLEGFGYNGYSNESLSSDVMDPIRGLGYVGVANSEELSVVYRYSEDASAAESDAYGRAGVEFPRGWKYDTSRAFDKLDLDRVVGTRAREQAKNESYSVIVDNPFMRVRDDSLSTFSIDVDTASYANTRRFLLAQSMLPPADAVRIEELINYFPYNYPSPDASQPFSVNVEVASAPWKPEHRLVKIGLKGREPVYSERKNANLVFLIDVSGSMNSPTKLPLLVESLSMLVRNLDQSDRVAIVVYAGSSGLVLDSTSCANKPLIIGSLERLSAGGSTNGGQGIRLAYAVAQRNFVDGGVNRVVLATDGDFNVGTTSQAALEELITAKAKDGVFLSVLGFGNGNLKDSTMELLADKGNGNYNYIDSRIEGHKVLVEQLGGTLVAIAKDVKIQIEFNPAEVQAFRLIGYENRVLVHRDFNDDTKDAGEIGSGHTVTALYEVVPTGIEFDFAGVDALRYQANSEPEKVPTEASNSGEMLTLKLRYKEPEGSKSRKIVYAVHDKGTELEKASDDFRFAAAVASFGMLLRHSQYKGAANWDDTLRLAQSGQGADVGGYRLEFTYLVQRAAQLSR